MALHALGPGVTQRQAEHVLERWRKRLVPEWSVRIDWDGDHPDDCRAQIHKDEDYLTATVTVRPDWLDRNGGHADEYSGDVNLEREVDLVHELCHLLFRELEAATGAMQSQLSGEAQRVGGHIWRHALEGAVERFARALVTERGSR